MRLNFLDKFADNVTMKKYASYLIILFLFSIIFSSCKYDLISAPKNDGNTSTSLGMGDTIEAPTGLSASQGLKRKIVLSWDSVKNAKQYQIFAAETPFDSFVQQGETSGTETSFTIEESYGQTRYFLVKAVNYYGTVSSGSTIVSGTTLDVPIITEISANGSGESMNIYWWMGNEEAYQDKVSYSLSVYTENDSLVEGLSIVIGDDKASAIVNGLSASTEYKFTVEAKNSDGESEISDKTTKETAHKIIPSAAKDLKASQGEAKDKVILSWTLPEFIDYYDKKTQIYSECPLYFTIERKLTSAADSSYQYVSKYVGSSDSSLENAYNFGEYEEGKEVTFEDTSAVRGKQYTYRVRSYTDTVSDTITSDDEASLSYTEGWKLSEADFSLSSVHNTEESDSGTKIVSVSVDFDLSFDSLQKEYIYEISEVRTDFSASESDQAKVIKTSDKIEDLSSYLHTIAINEENKASVQGFYSYTFNIKDTNGNVLESLAAANTVTVTDDADLIPEITSFTIKDGYKDKFILSWNAIEDAEYTLIWNSLIDGELSERESLTLSGDDYSVNDDTVTYEHTALSGESRYYTLTAVKNGIPDSKQYGSLCQTLGTAKPVMDEPDYSTITIQWPSVQKADSDYVITAYYVDDSNKTSIIDEANTSLSEEEGIVTCTITNPAGYDDWKVSGKAINFSVAAKNTDTGDQTSSENIEVRTLGPALVGTEADISKAESNRVFVSWNSIEGAKGYIIYRIKYHYLYDEDSSSYEWTYKASDKYFYDLAGEKITVNGKNDVSSSRAKITASENVFTLTDYACAQEDTTSTYEANQDELYLGLPFGYIVLPVNKSYANSGYDDFIFGQDSDTSSEESYLKITEGNANLKYTQALEDKKTATYGYGLNVTAAKAENQTTIGISWQAPYQNDDTIPCIYRRQNGDSSWTYIGSAPKNATTYSDTLTGQNLIKSYYYAVQYNTEASNINYKSVYSVNQEKIDTRYDDGITSEELNKGYLFYIDFSAAYNGTTGSDGEYLQDDYYYSEKVSHTKWNFTERARGPSSYTVSAKNVNTTLDYIKLADVTIDSESQKESISLNTSSANLAADGTNDTKLELNGADLVLSPIGITSGSNTSTNGLLKVLRSTKTFYKLNSSRSYSITDEASNKTNKTASLEEEVYGYRKLTDDELARCVGLIIADALYKAGIPYSYSADFIVQPKNDESSTSNGTIGTFKITHTSWANYSQWGFTGELYKHRFERTSSLYSDTYTSDFSFVAGISEKKEGAKSNTLYYLAPLEITVSDEFNINNSTIVFSAGSEGTSTKWNLSITKDGSSIVSISDNETDFLSYFPYDIGEKHASADSSLNTSLKTYQNDWWN